MVVHNVSVPSPLASLVGRPTIRSLARELGLSRTTVSAALCGTGGVRGRTAERVRAAAHRVGYRPNHMVSDLMSAIARQSCGREFRRSVALLITPEASISAALPRMRARTRELGFGFTTFTLPRSGFNAKRLEDMLLRRKVDGLLLWGDLGIQALSSFRWAHFAAIAVEGSCAHLSIHRIGFNGYGAVVTLMNKLAEKGYRRPGLCLAGYDQGRDDQILAAFQVCLARFPRCAIPPLLGEKITATQYGDWEQMHRPDIVIVRDSLPRDWVRADRAGRNLPDFASLDTTRTHLPCVGIACDAAVLGVRAIDLVVDQIRFGTRGLPADPTRTIIAARWTDGPTPKS